jgi:hypothetical protein
VDYSVKIVAGVAVDFAKQSAGVKVGDNPARQKNFVPAADFEMNSVVKFDRLVRAVLHKILAVGPYIAAVGIDRSVVPAVVHWAFDIHHCGVLGSCRDPSHDKAHGRALVEEPGLLLDMNLVQGKLLCMDSVAVEATLAAPADARSESGMQVSAAVLDFAS